VELSLGIDPLNIPTCHPRLDIVLNTPYELASREYQSTNHEQINDILALNKVEIEKHAIIVVQSFDHFIIGQNLRVGSCFRVSFGVL
jgi:hypothetical protein